MTLKFLLQASLLQAKSLMIGRQKATGPNWIGGRFARIAADLDIDPEYLRLSASS
jgi:hypothetical protein